MSASAFPLIASIQKAVHRAWNDRRFIMSLMALPMMVMFLSALLITEFLHIDSLFAMAVLLLPADFLKAIFVVLYFRFLILGEVLNPEKDAHKQDKSRAITGGVLAIIVVKFLSVGLVGFMLMLSRYIQQEQTSPYASLAFLAMIAGMVFAVWATRFYFLYVPIATGQSIAGFFNRYPGMAGSVRIFALVLLCTFIAALPAFIIETIMTGLMNVTGSETAAAVINGANLMIKVFLELCGAALLTAATAFAVTYKGQPNG